MTTTKKITIKQLMTYLGLFIMLNAAGLSWNSSAHAQNAQDDSLFRAGDWLLRFRATVIVPEDGADNVDIAGITSVQDQVVNVDNSFLPELDLSYFVTDNIAVEVICCAAFLRAQATGDLAAALGSFGLSGTEVVDTYALPATVMFQYHFEMGKNFKPYIGAGPTYVMFLREGVGAALKPIATKVKVEDSWGYTLQAGVDAHMGGNWFLNLDAKYMHVEVDAKWTTPGVGNGAIQATNLRLNPWILSMGIGYRF